MAVNKIFASDERLHRARPVPVGTQPGTPLLIGNTGRPAVTLTARGDSTVTQTAPVTSNIVSVTYTNGGVGLKQDEASCAFDGTWLFPVTGATTATTSEEEVFYVVATDTLTLASGGSDPHYGWTDYPEGFIKTAGNAPVRVGA